MKVIDLLNKIANDEEVPKEIKYRDYNWSWCEPCKIYETRFVDIGEVNLYTFFSKEGNLNDEIEIIEEPKKIEIPKHIPNEVIQDLDRSICPANVKCIAHKVNELINYLQYKDKINEGE